MIDNRTIEDLFNHTMHHIHLCNYKDATRSYNAFIIRTNDNPDPNVQFAREYLYTGVLSVMGMQFFKD